MLSGSNSPLQNLLLSGSVEGTMAIGDQQLSPGQWPKTPLPLFLLACMRLEGVTYGSH
jgi:hypothetical protein